MAQPFAKRRPNGDRTRADERLTGDGSADRCACRDGSSGDHGPHDCKPRRLDQRHQARGDEPNERDDLAVIVVDRRPARGSQCPKRNGPCDDDDPKADVGAERVTQALQYASDQDLRRDKAREAEEHSRVSDSKGGGTQQYAERDRRRWTCEAVP